MSILAQLIVELKAQTASFIDGLNAAAKTSRTVGKEIESSFSALGSVATSALAPFGTIGLVIGETLGKVGEQAGAAIISMGKLGGAMGAVTAVAGGAEAAMGAVALGSLGLATHTALSIAKIGELAQSTGIAVGPLSGLMFAFKATGVEAEAGVKGIEKLDKAIFKAATSPPTAVNAFTRLGISVKDTEGKIKDVDVIFTEIAGKFAGMQDGAVKTALAMELFGKGGAALIPALNKGKEGLQDLLATAQALGLRLDDQTAQAAIKFKESLETLEAAGTGLSYTLTKELLPALQTVTDFIVNGLKDKNSGLNDLISGFSFLTKVVLATGETIWAALKQIGIAIGNTAAFLIELSETSGKVSLGFATGGLSGGVAAAKDAYGRLKAITENFLSESKKDWQDYSSFTTGLVAPLPKASKQPGGGDKTDVNLKPAKEDTTLARIQERIAALQQEAADWALVASAGSQAEQLIAEALKQGNAEFGRLRTEAAKDKTGAALPFVQQNAGLIRAAGANAFLGKELEKTIDSLNKQAGKFQESGKAALAFAAAYEQGGAALADAAIDQKLAAEKAEVQKWADALKKAQADAAAFAAEKAKLAGAAGPVPGIAVDPSTINLLKTGLDTATAAYQRAQEAIKIDISNNLSKELKVQAVDFAALKPKVDALSDSYLQGAASVRKATIELQLQQFIQAELAKNGFISQENIEKKRQLLENSDAEEYASLIKREAAQYDINALYADEIVKLQDIEKYMKKRGESTLLIDAQLQDAQDRLIHQWDEAAFRVGTFQQRFQAVMGELVIQGREAGAAISQAFLSAIDSVETNLAKLLTGQKANFKAVAQNLAEEVTKAEIKKGVGELASRFGLKIPGLAAKPDGSSESLALWVKLVSGPGGLGGPASVPFGATNPFAGFGIGSIGAPEHGDLGGGGVLGLISSFFGGGLAEGGDMTPGRWYMAGERGPEPILAGRTGGRVFPTESLRGGTVNHFNFHYNHSADRDMFMRTDRQNAARTASSIRRYSRA